MIYPDCRLKENRNWYFAKLYEMNLRYGVMPGLVYLYMPALAQIYRWDTEDRLWFAFLNGMTQNPITSLRMFKRLPSVNHSRAELAAFEQWFNAEWERLQFDVDRRYQKRDTLTAINVYTQLVNEHGSQEAMLTNKPFTALWDLVRNRYASFGRLSSFSYLEYVYLNGFGADCDDLLYDDLSGSKSHRNGTMFLLGRDDMVWDKRRPGGENVTYNDLPALAGKLQRFAVEWLHWFRTVAPGVPNVSQFTFESNLCTFKNHFFGHRYPGIYADMAWDRIMWADAKGLQSATALFKAMRSNLLPAWLRAECEVNPLTIKQKAQRFPATGVPYRAEHFLHETPVDVHYRSAGQWQDYLAA